MYRCELGARSVTAEGVSLEMLGGARVGVVYLTVWPQSFSGDLNVCGVVDECVALLIAREAGLAKRKARNHNHDPTFDIFKQIVTLDLWKSPHYFKKNNKNKEGLTSFSSHTERKDLASSGFRMSSCSQHLLSLLFMTLTVVLMASSRSRLEGQFKDGSFLRLSLTSFPWAWNEQCLPSLWSSKQLTHTSSNSGTTKKSVFETYD